MKKSGTMFSKIEKCANDKHDENCVNGVVMELNKDKIKLHRT